MVWVRSEYAGELAVLSAWVTALIPWSVSFANEGSLTLVVVRFPLFLFQFLLGATLQGGEVPFLSVATAYTFPGSEAVVRAYLVWLVGGTVFATALALSIAYYVMDERLERWLPVDPVRLMGVLLLATAVMLTISTVQLWASFLGGSIPVGVIFLYVLGGLLLVVERSDASPNVDTGAAVPE
jgi:uncharacterized protein (TIGR04206 family)